MFLSYFLHLGQSNCSSLPLLALVCVAFFVWSCLWWDHVWLLWHWAHVSPNVPLQLWCESIHLYWSSRLVFLGLLLMLVLLMLMTAIAITLSAPSNERAKSRWPSESDASIWPHQQQQQQHRNRVYTAFRARKLTTFAHFRAPVVNDDDESFGRPALGHTDQCCSLVRYLLVFLVRWFARLRPPR